MARIPAVTRDSLREDLRGVFDEINAGPGGTGTGPMSVLKHSPEMAKRAIPLFEYVRNESIVPLPIRELAMLTTARAKDCPYIWNRHVTLARESGVSSDLIDALRDRKPLPPMSELRRLKNSSPCIIVVCEGERAKSTSMLHHSRIIKSPSFDEENLL